MDRGHRGGQGRWGRGKGEERGLRRPSPCRLQPCGVLGKPTIASRRETGVQCLPERLCPASQAGSSAPLYFACFPLLKDWRSPCCQQPHPCPLGHKEILQGGGRRSVDRIQECPLEAAAGACPPSRQQVEEPGPQPPPALPAPLCTGTSVSLGGAR